MSLILSLQIDVFLYQWNFGVFTDQFYICKIFLWGCKSFSNSRSCFICSDEHVNTQIVDLLTHILLTQMCLHMCSVDLFSNIVYSLFFVVFVEDVLYVNTDSHKYKIYPVWHQSASIHSEHSAQCCSAVSLTCNWVYEHVGVLLFFLQHVTWTCHMNMS